MIPQYFQIGDIVEVIFIGGARTCKIIDYGPNPQHPDRYIYKGIDVYNNTIIPYIGINGSEKYANIHVFPSASVTE